MNWDRFDEGVTSAFIVRRVGGGTLKGSTLEFTEVVEVVIRHLFFLSSEILVVWEVLKRFYACLLWRSLKDEGGVSGWMGVAGDCFHTGRGAG
jgi:hypothetical protein